MAETKQADPDRLDWWPEGVGHGAGADVDEVVRAAMAVGEGDPWANREWVARVLAALADQAGVPVEVTDAISLLVSEPNSVKAVRVARAVCEVLR